MCFESDEVGELQFMIPLEGEEDEEIVKKRMKSSKQLKRKSKKYRKEKI